MVRVVVAVAAEGLLLLLLTGGRVGVESCMSHHEIGDIDSEPEELKQSTDKSSLLECEWDMEAASLEDESACLTLLVVRWQCQRRCWEQSE